MRVCVCVTGGGRRGGHYGGDGFRLLRDRSLWSNQAHVRKAGHSSSDSDGDSVGRCLREREHSGAEGSRGIEIIAGFPRVKRGKDLHQSQQEFHLHSPKLTV